MVTKASFSFFVILVTQTCTSLLWVEVDTGTGVITWSWLTLPTPHFLSVISYVFCVFFNCIFPFSFLLLHPPLTHLYPFMFLPILGVESLPAAWQSGRSGGSCGGQIPQPLHSRGVHHPGSQQRQWSVPRLCQPVYPGGPPHDGFLRLIGASGDWGLELRLWHWPKWGGHHAAPRPGTPLHTNHTNRSYCCLCCGSPQQLW